MVPGLSLDILGPRSPGAVSAPSVTEEMQQEMGASQGSEVSMRASSEFELRDSGSWAGSWRVCHGRRKTGPLWCLKHWFHRIFFLRMMNLQDELREAQVNLAVQTARNEIASAKQQVAERSLELVNQRMQLLGQEKDEWKRRVGEMQPEPLETQRYEAASAPRAAGQPARDEGVPSPDLGEVQVKDELDEKGTALVPATWMHCLLFETRRKSFKHQMSRVVAFFRHTSQEFHASDESSGSFFPVTPHKSFMH